MHQNQKGKWNAWRNATAWVSVHMQVTPEGVITRGKHKGQCITPHNALFLVHHVHHSPVNHTQYRTHNFGLNSIRKVQHVFGVSARWFCQSMACQWVTRKFCFLFYFQCYWFPGYFYEESKIYLDLDRKP